MATSALSARILIATDIIGDAALVRGILNEEFDGVFASTDTGHAAADFVVKPFDKATLIAKENHALGRTVD